MLFLTGANGIYLLKKIIFWRAEWIYLCLELVYNNTNFVML